MSLLSGLTVDNAIPVEADVLGGFGPLESAIYDFKVVTAYLTKASSGALGLVLNLVTPTKQEHRETLWIASGNAKGNKNYYEKNGERHYLPGFIMADALCLLTVGKSIAQMNTEQKVVNVYNYDTRSEVPTQVDMLVDLIGQEIKGGVIKQIVDKNVKSPTGEYVPSGETREETQLDKLFRASDAMTTAEIRAQVPEASFHKSWADKWTGKVRNRATAQAGNAGAPAAGAPVAGAGVAGQGGARPATSLFG